MTAVAAEFVLSGGRGLSESRLRKSAIALAALAGSMIGVGTEVPLTNPRAFPTERRGWTQETLIAAPAEKPVMTVTGLDFAVSSSRPDVASAAEQVRTLRDASGLTWDQLARLFGVSRRTIHNWASGARLSALHAEALGQVTALLAARRNNTAAENRSWLLMSDGGNRSVFDEIRSALSARRTPIDELLTLRERLGLA